MITPLVLFAVAMTGVTGEWHSTAAMGSNVMEFTFALTQTGQSITGSVTIQDQVLPITVGVIHGADISLSAMLPAAGKLVPLPFTGSLEGAVLRLNMGGMHLTATRIQPTAQTTRIERLAGLFRLWGTIRFFHPYVAHGSINWDGALLAAIPKVESAANTDAYAAAIGAMLGALKDPETHVAGEAVSDGPTVAVSRRRLVRSGFPHDGSEYYIAWEPADSAATYTIQLPEQVRVVMRVSEPADTSDGISTEENGFDTLLPSREQRLLALAGFWNTIHYFYGYPDHLANWDAVLSEFIPIFESAGTWRDYVFAVSRLASRTNDSHTQVPALLQEFGEAPEVAIYPVEGRSLVTDIGPSVKDVERGDIVTAIDGEPVERRINSLLPLYPHSTSQAGRLMIHKLLLAGQEPTIRLRVEKRDGRQVEAVLTRVSPFNWQKREWQHPVIQRSTPVFGALPGGFGYMDLERLPKQDVNRAFDVVMNAPALIVDLRGGSDTVTEVAARLTEQKVLDALRRRRVWHGPDPAMMELLKTTQYLYPSELPKYKGRVVVLIDARAFSRAEHVCLFLEAAANATFIGSPTSGADGDITSTILPGGIQVTFAGQEIRHADGRNLQRVGILPDIWVEPTITGLRDGRDEVLEKAIQFLNQH